MNDHIQSYNGIRLYHLERNLYASTKIFENKVYIHVRNYTPYLPACPKQPQKLFPTKQGTNMSVEGFEKLMGSSTALLVEAAGLKSQLELPEPKEQSNKQQTPKNETAPVNPFDSIFRANTNQPTTTNPSYEYGDPKAVRQYIESLHSM